MRPTTTLILASLFTSRALAKNFTLADSYVGANFLSDFTWETINDPTNGTVNYVNQPFAVQNNLTYTSSKKFVMRADYKLIPANTSRGRESVRITSNKLYGDSVIVLNAQHMPEGPGTWPAFWTFSQKAKWPAGGEIDILENINGDTSNIVSMHTSPSCKQSFSVPQLSTPITQNCDANVNNNKGCSAGMTKASSYGSAFNKAGGGWYVMARSPTLGINVWFWARNETTVPHEVSAGVSSLMPSASWGKPSVHFAFDTCDYASHFDAYHAIIINFTFCGSWAGTNGATTGLSGTCADYVRNNPAIFQNALSSSTLWVDIYCMRIVRGALSLSQRHT